jgi:hypothetical protein
MSFGIKCCGGGKIQIMNVGTIRGGIVMSYFIRPGMNRQHQDCQKNRVSDKTLDKSAYTD